jgi:peptidoglycan biosynthesis protein MviN/MurJ (putative lipid II flippase)
VQSAAAAGDSITVATWTIVSRVTGVAKFACIGAVLGPTFFGNTYQFTNSLPNPHLLRVPRRGAVLLAAGPGTRPPHRRW